jgi:hypothetical protein
MPPTYTCSASPGATGIVAAARPPQPASPQPPEAPSAAASTEVTPAGTIHGWSAPVKPNSRVHTTSSSCTSHVAPAPHGASSHEATIGTQSGPWGTNPRSQASHSSPAQPSSHVHVVAPSSAEHVPCRHGLGSQASLGPVELVSTTPVVVSGSPVVVVAAGGVAVVSSSEPLMLSLEVLVPPAMEVVPRPAVVPTTSPGLKHAGNDASTSRGKPQRRMRRPL